MRALLQARLSNIVTEQSLTERRQAAMEKNSPFNQLNNGDTYFYAGLVILLVAFGVAVYLLTNIV